MTGCARRWRRSPRDALTIVDRISARTFGASQRSRRLAVIAFVYTLVIGGIVFVRSGRPDTIIREGEAAAAVGMIVPLFCTTVALVVLGVRMAGLTVDDGGVSWGMGLIAFRLRAPAIESCRLYRDAVAVTRRGRRFTWYVCARDYGPFPEVVGAFRRSRLPLVEDGGPAPLAARLQSYGLAIDFLLVIDALAVTAVFLLSSS